MNHGKHGKHGRPLLSADETFLIAEPFLRAEGAC